MFKMVPAFFIMVFLDFIDFPHIFFYQTRKNFLKWLTKYTVSFKRSGKLKCVLFEYMWILIFWHGLTYFFIVCAHIGVLNY